MPTTSARRRRDRRDHQLHEHEQSVGDARPACCEEGRGKRFEVKEYVKTSLAPGSAGRRRLSGKAGVMGDLKKLDFTSSAKKKTNDQPQIKRT